MLTSDTCHAFTLSFSLLGVGSKPRRCTLPWRWSRRWLKHIGDKQCTCMIHTLHTCIFGRIMSVADVRLLDLKLKQSLYRAGQTLRVAGGWGSQISRQTGSLSALLTGSLFPQLTLEAESTSGPWWDRKHCYWKMTPSGIETATFRLLAECFNELRHRIDQPLLLTFILFAGRGECSSGLVRWSIALNGNIAWMYSDTCSHLTVESSQKTRVTELWWFIASQRVTSLI
jgi:hypothetical protein